MPTLSTLKMRTAAVVTALTVALIPPTLRAQTLSARTEVNLPFGFEAGSNHFDAGTYILSSPQEYVLCLQGGNHPSLVMSWHAINLKASSTSKLVFHHYGGRYFLREVWTAGASEHLTLRETTEERSARREFMYDRRASIPANTNVEVALLETPR